MANNFQLPIEGFESYLYGILPEDQAVLAGAFSVAMKQITNIDNVDIQKFAKIVYSIETNTGLPLTNGTSVPVDTLLVDDAYSKIALGSGLYGVYTMSDFIGSMSGLPYPLTNIYEEIKELQTDNLTNIYKQIWEITTYSQATATLTVNTVVPDSGPITYNVTGITITNPGGGYTSAPVVTITDGVTTFNPAAVIGSDSEDPATYKRVASITLPTIYSFTNTPTITIAGPWAPGPAPSTAFWESQNNTLDSLITQADNEIFNIATSEATIEKAKLLNANWNILGTSLKIEHRARFNALAPVPIPRDPYLGQYPISLFNFVDGMTDYAVDTGPHGTAQSLENMADLCSTGGQSMIGLMREIRNEARLSEISVPLNNNIPDTFPNDDQQQLLANGLKCGAEDGVDGGNGLKFTIPAFAGTQDCDKNSLEPDKQTYFDNTQQALVKPATFIKANISPLLSDAASCNTLAPQIPSGIGGDSGGGSGNVASVLSTGIPNFLTGDTGNVIVDTLNIDFISNNLFPSTLNVQQAIDKVIECNCDCWIV